MLFDVIRPIEVEFMIGFALALVCGVLVGYEREHKQKPAGVKTHTFVVAASMLFTFLSHSWDNGDPTRIASQIVTGVGFLGAGIILKSEANKIQNVTTAASIWYAAAVGMAIGFQYYIIAVVAALAALAISHLPRFFKDGE